MGRIRVAVPDAEMYIKDYMAKDMSHVDRYIEGREREGYFIHSPIDIVNLVGYDRGDTHEHGYMFDREAMLVVLGKAGFARAAIRAFEPCH